MFQNKIKDNFNVENEKPGIKNMEKDRESLTRGKSMELNGELKKICPKSSQILPGKKVEEQNEL